VKVSTNTALVMMIGNRVSVSQCWCKCQQVLSVSTSIHSICDVCKWV